jgi:hypothetical protein
LVFHIFIIDKARNVKQDSINICIYLLDSTVKQTSQYIIIRLVLALTIKSLTYIFFCDFKQTSQHIITRLDIVLTTKSLIIFFYYICISNKLVNIL